jgi:hypothetical protein
VIVSSDPFTDLATSLSAFARGLRDLINDQRLPRPGSPADTESAGEPYANAWGKRPSGEIFASVLLQAWSSADHLMGAAELIAARSVVASPHTVMRASAESASAACFLSETGIDPLERIRRNMNYRLEALSQELVMMAAFTTPGAAEKVAGNEATVAAIAESGQSQGFRFHARDRHRSAYFEKKPPSAMYLMDQCASQTSGLGATYQRLLSSVAHSQLHGLTQFMSNVPSETEDGRVTYPLNTTAGNLARRLIIGPMCAATLVAHLGWFGGWDIDDQRVLVVRMLHTWGRIAGVPYPGPGA